MIVTADLHIHSPYSKTLEHQVSFDKIAQNAKTKGIDILGTGDCLHPKWIKNIKSLEKIGEGTFYLDQTIFILSTEIETRDGIHHLLFFPSISAVQDFKEQIIHFCPDGFKSGRSKINLSSELLAFKTLEVDGIIGPAHIFDANTGLYSRYDSIKACYKDMTPLISFVELGLGSDTYLADKIDELHQRTFLTNSDTHNPHPIRLGRQFTKFTVKNIFYSDIKKAILRHQGNRPILNVGFPPEEGKYFSSACIRCHKRFSYEDAQRKRWKCSCGSPIKKGVRDIINEKATYATAQHPYHRPLYLSMLPLHEIITRTLKEQNPFTEIVAKYYCDLVNTFGDEITVLLDTPINDILTVSTPSIAEAIDAFRNATVNFTPGGGGQYGSIQVPLEKDYLILSLKHSSK